jgi:hypothetical protein
MLSAFAGKVETDMEVVLAELVSSGAHSCSIDQMPDAEASSLYLSRLDTVYAMLHTALLLFLS